jgi:hypothetical protein
MLTIFLLISFWHALFFLRASTSNSAAFGNPVRSRPPFTVSFCAAKPSSGPFAKHSLHAPSDASRFRSSGDEVEVPVSRESKV